jgi:hypothetical protein
MARTSKGTMKELYSEVNRELDRFFDALNTEAKALTPVKTGRAKRGWRRAGNASIGQGATTEVVITNPVPYIAVLDKGSSRQAPQGMFEPALKKVTRRYK